MINELINFYSKNLTLTGLIKKYYAFYFYAVIVAYTIVSVVILFLYFNYNNYWLLSSVFLPFIGLLCARKYLDYFTIIKINSKFIRSKGYDSKKLNNYFFEELEKYLKHEHLLKIENDIILVLKEKSQSIKIPFIFISGIFSALSLSIFTALCKKLYDISGSINEIFFITILLLLIVILVIYLLYFFRDFYFGYFTQYNKINNLVTMLEENKLKRNVEDAKSKNCPIVI